METVTFVLLLRMLMKSPGSSGAVVLCLMLDIGATTAIFSVANALRYE